MVSFLRGHILHAHLKRILGLVKSRVFVCMTTKLLKVIFWYLSKTLPWMCIFPQSATNHSQKKYRNENRWYLPAHKYRKSKFNVFAIRSWNIIGFSKLNASADREKMSRRGARRGVSDDGFLILETWLYYHPYQHISSSSW